MGDSPAVVQRVDQLIGDNDVMVFSKSYCPYCKMAKDALNSVNADFKVLELDNDKDGPAIQNILGKRTGASSVPRVFIRGTCIGGGSETKELKRQGKLKSMIEGK